MTISKDFDLVDACVRHGVWPVGGDPIPGISKFRDSLLSLLEEINYHAVAVERNRCSSLCLGMMDRLTTDQQLIVESLRNSIDNSEE